MGPQNLITLITIQGVLITCQKVQNKAARIATEIYKSPLITLVQKYKIGLQLHPLF